MELLTGLGYLKERKGSCGPKTRATICRIEEFLQGRSSRLDTDRAAGHPFYQFFVLAEEHFCFGESEPLLIYEHLNKRKCSCDPKPRSGSSRTDDTESRRVCCLPTAFSRDRIAGHPP